MMKSPKWESIFKIDFRQYCLKNIVQTSPLNSAFVYVFITPRPAKLLRVRLPRLTLRRFLLF